MTADPTVRVRSTGPDDALASYPAEPWDLRGQLHASVFLVPASALALDLPPGCRPVRLAGRLVAGAAWVHYEPGGVLSYREVMATVLVRRGLRLMPHIVAIWVDSETSRDGGRGLWGIPKGLARFEERAGRWTAGLESGPVASATVRVWRALPGRWPTPFSVVQWLDGAAKISPVRSRSRVAVSSVAWDVAAAGPLGFLAGRRPLASFTLADFRMSFGRG